MTSPALKNAITVGRTKYLKNVRAPSFATMLKRGKLNKKLGDKVQTKKWKSMTMYSLTLEERATCPSTCKQWETCYGNNMPFGHRFDHTHPDFYTKLESELEQLNEKHPDGFVVRLHVLGDFFSTHYVVKWQYWLHKYPALRVFGYTHWERTSDIGSMIKTINRVYKDRWAIRFSDDPSTQFSAHVTPDADLAYQDADKYDGIICPEQTGRTKSCTTCGYCWTSQRPVIFIEH